MRSRFSFRTVDEWKSALMILPESGFFELLRSVFGNIKTPFNKQRLLDDLFNLLSRDEIRKTIADYINEQDHKLIAAVALLNEPVTKDLENFFSGEFGTAELHAVLINLEERLIVYRFREKEEMRLTLNPVLESILAPFVADTRLLFPSFPKEAVQPESGVSDYSHASAWMHDPRAMAALFAFISGEDEFFKAEVGTALRGTLSKGTAFPGIRKKIMDEGKRLFPGLDLELAVRILLALSLFRSEGRSLLPCMEKFEDYKALSFNECQEYWAAGLYVCLNEPGRNSSAVADLFARSRLYTLASFFHRFMGCLKSERSYPETTIRRQVELMGMEERMAGNAWNSPLFSDRIGRPRARFPLESFLVAMEKAGLLEKQLDYWGIPPSCRALSMHSDSEDSDSEDSDSENSDSENGDAKELKPVIVMDTAFSFILYPEISFADALALGTFCSIKDMGASGGSDGTAICFELTRKSVVRGFDNGISSDDMLALLDRLSCGRLDANLGWTLSEWGNRYAGVSLSQGIVLTLAEDLQYLAKARQVSSLIQRTLAPGVYLLSSEERSEAFAALQKAGVDIIAQPPSSSHGETGRSRFSRTYYPRLDSYSSYANLASPSSLSCSDLHKEGAAAEAASHKENLRRVLEKMKITRQERDELLARIERRLILSEAQLEGTYLRYEKLEARGLDYAGKMSIAKQAIEAGSLLDVSWPLPGGEISRAVGRPQTLEKKEGESVLVLKDSKNTAKVLRIPLGKISNLRRIKQSIFGE